ncbi:MAG: rhomboid family intramembrane serine protease [Bacillota bacterium]
MMELKHSFQTKLIENRFMPMKKQQVVDIENTIDGQSDWYAREENPILYLVSIVDTEKALLESDFFAYVDAVGQKMEESFFSRIIALEIFLGKQPEIVTVIPEDVENENIHKIQWYFDYENQTLEAPKNHPTKLLGIEKLLFSALAEPPKVSVLNMKSQAKPPYISLSIFVIWVFLLLDGFVSNTHVEMILEYGMSRRAITEGEYYRFISSMFLHADLRHLLSNMIYLYYFGTRLERIYGPVKYLFLYIFCGLTAGLFSIAFSDVLSIGASGATYGLLGATLVIVKKFGTRYISMNYTTIVLLGFLGLSTGFFVESIDNFGHIGGIFAGCCLGVTLRDQQTATFTFKKKE